MLHAVPPPWQAPGRVASRCVQCGKTAPSSPCTGGKGIAGDRGAHLAVTQDAVGEGREDRFACRALETSDGAPAQTAPDIMGVTRQASSSAPGRLVRELKP